MTSICNQELNFSFSVPLTESAQVNEKFIIKGVAINATVTGNNHKFLEEELRMAAGSLKGVPLLVDHDNRVESIKGRVINSGYDELNKRIPFEANVIDKQMREMIKDGRINSVSVGAMVKGIEESEDGVIIPRGITFKELSLVAVPADSNATFTCALHEAYNKIKGENMINDILEAKKETALTHSIITKSSDITLSERGSNRMEEKLQEAKVDPSVELAEKLKAAEAKIAEFEAEKAKAKRNALEESYKNLCTEKKVPSIDVSKMSDEVVETLKAQVSALPTPTPKVEEKVEAKEEAKVEEAEEEIKVGKYRIVSGVGSLRGGSYTVEWY